MAVTGITVAPTTASVQVGDTATLTATIAPSSATNKTLTWSSSDATIATVSATGVITGIKAGTANITAKSTDGSNITSNACAVTITTNATPEIPVITASDTVPTGMSGNVASVPDQSGCTFAWTITGGTITSSASGTSIIFTAGPVGTLTLNCTATNAKQISSSPGSKVIQVVLPVLQALSIGLPAAGGVADAGFTGEYFANDALNGTSTFTRRDVRIDFDWEGRGPGGSFGVPYKDIPATNFSIRWTGTLLPRLSETYTLKVTGDSARLAIKQGGTWQTLINQWPMQGGSASATVSMTAGTPLPIRLEYQHANGNGGIRLSWSSVSAPEDVIHPAGGLACNAYNSDGMVDAMKNARDEWMDQNNANATRDANGWPTQDATCMIWEGVDQKNGMYLLTFEGKADVSDQFNYATFTFQNYDAATNTSTWQMNVTDTSRQNFVLRFNNTRRTAASALNTGVANISAWGPVSVGSSNHAPAGSIWREDLKTAYARYTTLRFMAGTNWNDSVVWSDRTPMSHATQRFARPNESGYETNGIAWEYRIALCNEIGKDLYINIPAMANDDYITKLAQLIKFGSDGVNPYTTSQANPVCPPLNSNLKVYVEYSNEVWNYGFSAWRQNFDAAQAEYMGYTPLGAILTYDGDTDQNVLWIRRFALRSLQISNLFRSVFGDQGMGDKVRMLLEWQYDNAGWPPMAQTALDFLDRYFNNADGQPHVTTPHPVNYYFWGGGGANYYGATDADGATVDAIFAGDIPAGVPNNASGAATLAGYQTLLRTEANWTKLYGLRNVAYEGGWALGGDGGGSSVQNAAKYSDPRAADANRRAIDAFYRAGGDLSVFGTYAQWTTWANSANEPIPQSVDTANGVLPAEVTNGVAVPATLLPSQVVTENGQNIDTGAGGTLTPNSFMRWNVLVPATGLYTITPETNNPVSLVVDGSFATSPIILSKGLHTIRLIATANTAVTKVTVGQ